MDYFINKNELKKKAVSWTEKMAALYQNEIKEAIENTKKYDSLSLFPVADKSIPEVVYTNAGTVEALFEIEDEGKIAILNFASYKNPGGLFIGGSSAQEEMLCHHSFLYNVLREFEDSYYERNRSNLNRGLYQDECLYSPDITFFNEDATKIADVITCAAPNKSLLRYGRFTSEENTQVLKKRAQFIKNIAQVNNVEVLILGAWGCGVFKQEPEEVAKIFEEVFAKTSIKKIVYAVPGSDNNAKCFQNHFSK